MTDKNTSPTSDPPFESKAEPLTWDPSEIEDWSADVLRLTGGWRSIVVDGDVFRYELRGACPRCGFSDGIDAWAPGDTLVIAAAGLAEGGLEGVVDVVTVECSTRRDITDRPKSVAAGCGAWGEVWLIGA